MNDYIVDDLELFDILDVVDDTDYIDNVLNKLDRVHIQIDCDRFRLVRFSLQSFPVITTVHTAHLIRSRIDSISVVFRARAISRLLLGYNHG